MKTKTIFMTICLFFATLLTAQDDANKLDQIKQAIKAKSAKWIAGKTSMSHFEGKIGGLTSFQMPADANAHIIHLPMIQNLPENFDWRDNNGNWTTQVRNQNDPPPISDGYCGAFASLAQVEAWWKIKYNDPDTLIDLSEQWVISNLGLMSGNPNMLMGLIAETGVPLESCFPYQGNHTIPVTDACPNWEENAVKIPGWGFITIGDEDIDAIKIALLRHPLTIGYDVYQDFISYQSGVYEHVWGNFEGEHTVLLVGWDDADSSWICENNWGTDWGETSEFQPHTPGTGDGGYFRIKYGECEIGFMSWFIWNEMTTQEAFVVSPQHVYLKAEQGDEISYDYHLKNNGIPTVEYSAILNETNVQSKFHLSEFQAWNGLSWWCGDPDMAGYGNYWLQYLDLPIMDISMSNNPKLTFMGKWALDDVGFYVNDLPNVPYDGKDGCNVWISTDGGKQFDVMQPVSPSYNCNSLCSFGDFWGKGFHIPGWAGISTEWLPVEFNLSSYKSDSVVIRFAFASDNFLCVNENPALKVFFIDDIQVFDDSEVLFENYGDSLQTDQDSSYAGNEKADWLTVSNGGGTIASYDSTIVTIHIDTQLLEPGSYSGIVSFAYNDLVMMPYNPTSRFTQFDLQVDPITSVNLTRHSLPTKWQLCQNYPNPFNPSTIVKYEIPNVETRHALSVQLTIYDILGREVATLVNQKQKPGYYEVQFTSNNVQLTSGVYFYKIQAGDFVATKKMILLR